MFRNRYGHPESIEQICDACNITFIQRTDEFFRRTSQKPDEELICNFKKSFPSVLSSVALANAQTAAPPEQGIMEPVMPARPVTETEDLKVHDPTPRALQDFRFTPSLMDPNSLAFMSFANQPPGYYTPTPGGMNTLYHSSAGDLHTPTLGLNLATPMSMQNPASGPLPVDPTVEMNLHLQHHFLPQQFQNLNPFAQQAAFAPSTFLHHGDSGYDPGEDAVMDDVNMPVNPLHVVTASDYSAIHSPIEGEKFRYNVTLRAPTAMIKHADEIPVTYLNKGQAYSISVVDTAPVPVDGNPVKYRTYVRVSFEDEQQRKKPSACWQLWKEGRGMNEAHQRGGKLLAVEYVDPIQGGDDQHRHPQIQLESASFDGFCVTWTPNPATGSTDCAISVRFNFLSTDFSHSKGVKGIPVRLCAKTEMVSTGSPAPNAATEAEVCYCKVKLFRDHGAERKLSNDVAHVKKTIDKLKQQIAQAEMGAGSFGKRKRSNGSIAIKAGDNRPVKIPKHKRTWSIDSQTESPGKLSAEEDLHMKLAMLQDMFSSTRPVSVLSLRGDEQDDPDLFPVTLPGEPYDITKFEALSRQSTRESRPSIDATSAASVMSPTNSSISMNSPHRPPDRQLSNLHSYQTSRDHSRERPSAAQKVLLSHPIKVQKVPSEGSKVSNGYIEAVDIDPTYRPPSERPAKPIACFYVRFPNMGEGDDYYRAIYLTERTAGDLLSKITEKQKMDPGRVVRVVRVNSKGLNIMVDDDVVRELPDGQDMVAEISEASTFEEAAPDPSAIEIKLTY
ncbi:hypothetical protein Plec18170_003039 [Paecilomyces lecythidis]